jgi:beta-glucanase (GH16 family)
VPAIPGGRALVDPDTPAWALSKSSWFGRGDMELVFSDEFNTEGRTFYPGDDPYWEAVDLWYWPTGDREWYDPSAITTSGGSLTITFTDTPSHGMNYTSDDARVEQLARDVACAVDDGQPRACRVWCHH